MFNLFKKKKEIHHSGVDPNLYFQVVEDYKKVATQAIDAIERVEACEFLLRRMICEIDVKHLNQPVVHDVLAYLTTQRTISLPAGIRENYSSIRRSIRNITG
jgi:hypothetical protein